MFDDVINQFYAGRRVAFKNFGYLTTFDFSTGATLTNVINIQANLDFIWMNNTYWKDSGAAQTASTRELFDGTVLIVDSATGEQFTSQPQYVDTVYGTGQFPYILPEPMLLRGKSTLQITCTVLDGSAPLLQLCLNGVNIIDRGPL